MKLLAFLLLLSASAQAYTPPKAGTVRIIEDFQGGPEGKFPVNWRTYPFQRGKAREVYQVAAEHGNHFLRALDSQNFSVQIFREFSWATNEYPKLSWRWRAQTIPAGGDERNADTNDSACGVYVVFGKYTGTAIKYVWSSTLPVGTIIEKKPGHFYLVVVNSGESRLKQWHAVSINALQDYQRLFKMPPSRPPSGFGILTDGNALQTTAACDYDDFQVSHED